jgi:hypothetical protein
MNLHEKILTL